jgi:hypothetical protein
VIGDEEEPRVRATHHSAYAHDSGWELPELAPVLIILSVALLVAGSGISTGMSLIGQTDLTGGAGWTLVSSALRWVDPSTSTMLLLSAALIWWQYGYWNSSQSDTIAESIVDEHMTRLRTIAKWNLAAFIVTLASVFVLILASILQNTYEGSSISIWAYSVETFCEAIGIILLSLLGVVGLQRILASARPINSEDGPEYV